MSRDIHPEVVAEVQGEVVRPFLVCELDYPDGTVRASSLPFNIVLDGHEYMGTSTYGSVGELTEGAEQQSYSVGLGLSGIPGNFAAYLSSQDVQGREAVIRLGFVNAQHQVIGQLCTIFVGRMNTQDVTAGKNTSVQLGLESLLVDWERPRVRRFTDADQKARFPTDRGLEYVSAVASMEIVWGRG